VNTHICKTKFTPFAIQKSQKKGKKIYKLLQ